jgi:hypothetical protein
VFRQYRRENAVRRTKGTTHVSCTRIRQLHPIRRMCNALAGICATERRNPETHEIPARRTAARPVRPIAARSETFPVPRPRHRKAAFAPAIGFHTEPAARMRPLPQAGRLCYLRDIFNFPSEPFKSRGKARQMSRVFPRYSFESSGTNHTAKGSIH